MNKNKKDEYIEYLVARLSADLDRQLSNTADPVNGSPEIANEIMSTSHTCQWSTADSLSPDALFVIAEELTFIMANNSSVDIVGSADAAYLAAVFLWRYTNNATGGEYESAKSFIIMIIYSLFGNKSAIDAQRKFLKEIHSRISTNAMNRFAAWEIQLSAFCCICASLRMADPEWIGGLPTIPNDVEAIGYGDSLGSELAVLCMPEKIRDIYIQSKTLLENIASFIEKISK
jgi:hypothetical protein